MSALDRKATDLCNMCQEFIGHCQTIDATVINGPHVELSLQELRLVEYVGDRGPKIMRELAEYLVLAVNSVTSLVDHLETRGLVTRKRSDEDRRIVRVELTDAGRVAHQAALREKLEMMRSLLVPLTEEEQDIFLLLFRKITRNGRTSLRAAASSK